MILILDFGSQVTQLIARRVREMKVYCEIYPGNMKLESFGALENVKGIILSGGSASVYDADAPKIPKEILNLNIPLNLNMYKKKHNSTSY